MKLISSYSANQSSDYLKTVFVVVNPKDNGGESVTLSVDVFDNGDGLKEGMYTNLRLETQCYGISSAKITLWGPGFDSLMEAMKLIAAELEKMRNDQVPA